MPLRQRSYALGENYLYTVEGLKTFLDKLAPGGYLSVTLGTKVPPRDTLKLLATAIEALKKLGVQSPEGQLIVLRSWQKSTFLVKNGLITDREITRTLSFCEKRSFDPVYFPGIRPEQSNRRNRVREDYFFLEVRRYLAITQRLFRTITSSISGRQQTIALTSLISLNGGLYRKYTLRWAEAEFRFWKAVN